MRRVRSDVSHRIRRRTSIFAARWFRGLLVAGLVVIVALLVGPGLVDRMGVDLPRGLTPLLPWTGSAPDGRPEAARPPGAPVATVPATPPTRSAPPTPVAPEAPPPRDRTVVEAAPTPTPSPTTGATAPGAPAPAASRTAAKPSAAPRPAPAEETPPAGGGGALTSPPSIYWVQVGAFQDARNAERLVERLKGDGMSAATTTFEQSRVQYRVLLLAQDGTSAVPDDVLERVRGLGLAVETSPDGPAVTGLVPLRKAVETSHTLRQQGIRVRLKQEVGSSTFRVVRVGSFPTSAAAEATLASLASRGIEGVIVRER